MYRDTSKQCMISSQEKNMHKAEAILQMGQVHKEPVSASINTITINNNSNSIDSAVTQY